MKKYIRSYLDAFGYDEAFRVPCEVCQRDATDFHHIKNRGMGGSKLLDGPENIAALCRSCHKSAHEFKCVNEKVKACHEEFMLTFCKECE